jgi:tRNA dimethylallyltransferase
VRALEVFDATGRRFSSFGRAFDEYPPPALDVKMIGFSVVSTTLAARIEERVQVMRAAGLLDEACRVAASSRGLSRTAAKAIGYAEMLAFDDGAIPDLDDAFTQVVRRTRRFARRQRVWFRRDPRIQWMETEGKSDAVAAAILAAWRGPIPAPV